MSAQPEFHLPRPFPVRIERTPQANIPPARRERDALLGAVRSFVTRGKLVPPVPLDDLRALTKELLEGEGFDEKYLEYAAVLVNNELWRETLATIPYERRLLLLPKCLRVEEHCPAPFDEFGLLCKKCGMCSIEDLQNVAEQLGYAVLVAEGSPIVMAIIETGKIDAIVGVSCLNVLERAFPYMEAAAIPGVAIPLLQDDCADTNVDEDQVWDVIHLTSDDQSRRMDLSALRDEVDTWFEPAALREVLGDPSSPVEEVGEEWLARAGKRWRPFLAAAVRQALVAEPGGKIPLDARRVAIAVECFHKASLVHDDIEDHDSLRYGERTLWEQHGVEVALNAGDWLIGEGYRLLAECDVPAETSVALLRAAARGHRTLCVGQGRELAWARDPSPLPSRQVLEIFRQKTAPAFEVALLLGAHHAGIPAEAAKDRETFEKLVARYSAALGVAYQIRDDLEDLEAGETPDDLAAARPTLPLALGYERAAKRGKEKRLLGAAWKRQLPENVPAARLREALERTGAIDRARELLEAYKSDAVRSLWDVGHPTLKGLLRRVIGKIFDDVRIEGWCGEFEARNAAGRKAGDPPAA